MGLTNTALPHDIARPFPVLVIAEVVADRAEARSAHEIEKRLFTKDLHVCRQSSRSSSDPKQTVFGRFADYSARAESYARLDVWLETYI